METKFDPKAKVKQGDTSLIPDGKQPNQEATNIDLNKHASVNIKDIDYPTKSGKEHVQDSLFKLADQKDY